MIIAYPLADINSMFGKTCYQKQGIPCRVIVFMDNVAILENKQGAKFPVNKNKLIWHSDQ